MIKRDRLICRLALVFCIMAFIGGEYLLETIRWVEDPTLSITTHVICACALMMLSIVAVYLLIRHLIYLQRKEKRRKNTVVVFLDKDECRPKNA
jgi:TRAP-type C4-dicarboxylate transport system permease small subunit